MHNINKLYDTNHIMNTLGIDVHATRVFFVENFSQLIKAWHESIIYELPILILGEGSNVVFLEDYRGIVIFNRLKGISITEQKDYWHLHVRAGEYWQYLVELTLKKGIFGLENLAFIPGYVGAAPIQNIGAYGVEFADFCEYVEIFDLNRKKKIILSANECNFGYRDSIFKHTYKNHHVITAVGLIIKKKWYPNINHDSLVNLNSKITAQDILNIIWNIRTSKLPNTNIFGNAGSFFKNPIIDIKQARTLLLAFPNIPYYQHDDNKIKLSAGWLIEKCNLKGYLLGGAAVHSEHALILINKNKATGLDIALLADKIRQDVGKKFNIWLEPEVRFFKSNGEINFNLIKSIIEKK
ncbi:MAG: UDP-N-acetylmuramate dehydrogenase [Candidatus Dasytiphilus stammeri]